MQRALVLLGFIIGVALTVYGPEKATGALEEMLARAGVIPAATQSANAPPVQPDDLGSGQKYVRALYGDGWDDENGDCRNTRAEVLIQQSVVPVHMRKSGCSVERGKWNDPYTGKTFTSAKDVDIDHMVPLAWAHYHGADAWPPQRKLAFANWPANLFAVQASVNREKGADGPLNWLPPRVEYRCEYILRFERIVETWELRMSPTEMAGMSEIKSHWCPSR